MATGIPHLPDILLECYATKSPPREKMDSNSWRRRYCVLCYKSLSDMKLKSSSFGSDVMKSIRTKVGLKKRLSDPQQIRRASITSYESRDDKACVLCYYEKKEDLEHYLPIKEFNVEGSKVTNVPNGIGQYRYVVKIQFSKMYNNREMYLCFDSADEQIKWRETMAKHTTNKYSTTDSEDFIEADIKFERAKPLVIPDAENSLLKRIEDAKIAIREEEYAKLGRRESSFDAKDDLFDECFYTNGENNTDSGISNGSRLSEQYKYSRHSSEMRVSGYGSYFEEV